VEHMLFTFEGCTALTTAPDMTKCTSVTDMMFAFKGCTALLAAPDITKCTSLTNMDFTFKGCTALATGPSMIPASVTKMDYTFLDCKALKGTMQINASPSYYDYVFDGASTNAGTDLKVYSNDATNESTVQAIVNDTKTTSSSSNITYGGYKVKSWNIGSDTAGNYYTGSNGTDKVVATLYSVGELAVTGTGDTVVFYSPVAPWCEDTYKAQVKSSTIASTVKPTNMQFWYNGCSNLTAAPAIPDSVTVMPYTFNNCTSLTKAPDLTGCTSLKSMFATFYGCTSLMDMSSYIIPAGVKDMTLTFKGCTSLTKAPAIPSGMENMSNTFLGCTALLAAPDITKCTSLTNMNSTFNECTALATGPSVIPASVTNMYDAFYDCKSLTGTMQINASPTDYNGCFNYASTNTGTLLKVNYTSGNASIIDFIIQTGTKYGSHIERGVQN
jgi:hypothetical protein